MADSPSHPDPAGCYPRDRVLGLGPPESAMAGESRSPRMCARGIDALAWEREGGGGDARDHEGGATAEESTEHRMA